MHNVVGIDKVFCNPCATLITPGYLHTMRYDFFKFTVNGYCEFSLIKITVHAFGNFYFFRLNQVPFTGIKKSRFLIDFIPGKISVFIGKNQKGNIVDRPPENQVRTN
jgi:hypothetical protein